MAVLLAHCLARQTDQALHEDGAAAAVATLCGALGRLEDDDLASASDRRSDDYALGFWLAVVVLRRDCRRRVVDFRVVWRPFVERLWVVTEVCLNANTG